MPATPKPKARRTHARRSCNLCKVRKTRCELPDLSVPSSSEPVPKGKACHRCQVLSLPCVVDDSNMKSRRQLKPPAAAANSDSPKPASVRGKGSEAERNTQVNGGPTRQAPLERTALSADALQAMRIDSRPLSLLSVMLKFATGDTKQDLDQTYTVPTQERVADLIDDSMRTRLAPGMDQLRTLHPHLQRLDELCFLSQKGDVDSALELLLAATVYLALQALPKDTAARRLRTALVPHILHHQNIVLIKQPPSFYAIQALEVLALHAPLSPALPFHPTDLRQLSPSHGLVGTARNIATLVNFNNLVNSGLERRDNPDFWLWLALRVAEAQASLEDELPHKSGYLADAREKVDALLLPENEHVWVCSAPTDDPPELLGKLAVCDRLTRLEELYDTRARLRQILSLVYEIPNFPAIAAVGNELNAYDKTMASMDQRHARLIQIINPGPEVAAAWMSYRAIRSAWEQMAVLKSAFTTLVALHYLPESVVALPDLPSGMTARKAVLYATARARKPEDIATAYKANTPAAGAMLQCAGLRPPLAERILAEMAAVLPTSVLPLHDAASVVVESAKCLMECTARAGRDWPGMHSLPAPQGGWIADLRRVATLLGDMSEPGCVASGCAGMLSAMARVGAVLAGGIGSCPDQWQGSGVGQSEAEHDCHELQPCGGGSLAPNVDKTQTLTTPPWPQQAASHPPDHIDAMLSHLFACDGNLAPI